MRTKGLKLPTTSMSFPVGMVKPRKKVDPLIREMKRQYRASAVFQVDKLIAERRKWQRKATIANTKLEDIRMRTEKLLVELAKEKVDARTLDELKELAKEKVGAS